LGEAAAAQKAPPPPRSPVRSSQCPIDQYVPTATCSASVSLRSPTSRGPRAATAMAPRPRPQGGRQPRQQQPQVLSNLQSLLLHAAPTLPQYSQVRGRLAACGLPRSSPASFRAPLPPACLSQLPDRPALQLGELDHPSSSSGGGAYFTLQDLWCAPPLAVCCQIGRLVTVGRPVQLACPPCRPAIGAHALSAGPPPPPAAHLPNCLAAVC
jgi:hypothetical protein